MCATKTCSTLLALSAPSQDRWKLPTFVKAMIVILEAFQEAFDMRRVAHRIYFLSDE